MPRKILIVDDNRVNRMVLARMLHIEYDVIEAENGVQALEILRREGEDISAVLLDLVMPLMDGYQVLETIAADEDLMQIPVIVTTSSTAEAAESRALSLGANDFVTKPYNPSIIRHRLRNTIRLRETAAQMHAIQRDRLTGLYNREAFFAKAEEMIAGQEPGYYVMACFDLNNFKVINDRYGSAKGDDVLKMTAQIFREGFEPLGGICGRIMGDHFAVLYPTCFITGDFVAEIRRRATKLDGSIDPVSYSIGRYIVNDLTLSGSAMYDRAAIAQASVKARFDSPIAQYDESMRESILREQEIVGSMDAALKQGQFENWYQPQYNHSSGALIGAEALVRWRHPEKGLIPPGDFIPVFERNGFIYEMDKCVWENACKHLRAWIDQGLEVLPVSVNISRYDIFCSDFFDTITGLVRQYDLPIALLKLEVTESAFAQSAEQIIKAVKRLIDYGFTVEIDDFGSGYSSLNTLKDVPADILKLDMRFLNGTGDSERGGNILESIIRMAKWLGMPVIAEGVETKQQADYLRSIGCFYMQGYLYARPMPEEAYRALLAASDREAKMASLETVEKLDNNAFWNPDSIETLIFNSYVGGACVFEYTGGRVELLRVNEKYAREIGGENMTMEQALATDVASYMDEENRLKLVENIERAIATDSDSTTEVVMTGVPGGTERTYIRSTVRVIARAGTRMLLYCSVINITPRRESERREREATAQLNAIAHGINGGVTAVTIDENQEIHYLFANEQFYTQIGYTREQFKAEVESIFDLTHPDDRDRIVRETMRASAEKCPVTLTYRVFKRDGTLSYVRCNIAITEIDGYDRPVQVTVTNDITDEVSANLRLTEAAEQLRFLNETSRELFSQPNGDAGIHVVLNRVLDYFDGDRSYVIEMDDDTQTASNTYEVCAPGIAGEMALLKVIPYDAMRFWIETFANSRSMEISDVNALPDSRVEERELLLAQNITALTAVSLLRGDKAIGLIGVDNPKRHSSHVTQLLAIGDYVAVMLARRDMNARVERERRQSTSAMNDALPVMLKAMMASSNDLSFVKDSDFRYLCCSRPFARMAGLNDEAEIAGKTDFELFSEDFALAYRADDQKLMEAGQSLVDYIERIPSLGGAPRYANTSKYLLFDASGSVIGMYGVGRDVTDEREAHAQLKLLANSIPGGIAMYDLAPGRARMMYCSDGYCAAAGYSREEYAALAAKDITSLVCDEDAPKLRAMIDGVLGGNDSFDYTYRARCKHGERRWINLRGTVLERGSDGVIVNVVKFDITDRVRYDEALRVTEEQYRLALEYSGSMIARYDVTERSLTTSPGVAAVFGTPVKLMNVPETPIREGLVSHETAGEYAAFFADIRRGAKRGDAQFECKTVNGWRWFKARFISVFSDAGAPLSATVVLEDVTRERAETAAYRESEQVLRLVAEHSNREIYRYDIASKTVYADERVAGGTASLVSESGVPDEVIARGDILPESVEDYRRVFDEMARGVQSGGAKVHTRMKNGEPRWIDLKYSLIPEEDGKPKAAVISYLDITESHEKELAYERYLQSIDEKAVAEGVLLYLEADLTADQSEKTGSVMLLENFPAPGSRRAEVIDFISRYYIAEDEREKCREFFSREHLITAFSDGVRAVSEDWSVHLPSGQNGFVRSEVQMVQDPYTGHIKSYTILRDITKEKFEALEVRRKAEQDGMTGLYNKATAEALIADRLISGGERPCALLVIDLDNLKGINDSQGHAQGDAAIKRIGETLRSQFRKGDIIGRVGGDEFVVFLDNCGTETWLHSSMMTLIKRFSTLRAGGRGVLPLRASVGITMSMTGREEYAELFRRADLALYHVKRNGKNDFAFYKPDMEKNAYCYKAHDETETWRESLFNREELDYLLTAVAALYPLVLSVNLTQNTYYMMNYDDYYTRACVDSGTYDDLIAEGVKTFHPDDRQAFLDAFARENLLAAHARGEQTVTHRGRQLGDDKVYRRIRTDVIFVKNHENDDVIEIALAREIGAAPGDPV